MKKLAIGCGSLLVLAFGFVVLVFYILSIPKIRDVSEEIPFIEILHTNITTQREILILKNPDIPKRENYPYHVEDGNSYGMDVDLEIITTIPVGTEVILEKTELYTNRVSGGTFAYIFGKVFSEETQEFYPFEYTWGTYHSLQEEPPYWTFELAFWQRSYSTQKYYIEVP